MSPEHVTILDQQALEEIAEVGDSLDLAPLPCAPGERAGPRWLDSARGRRESSALLPATDRRAESPIPGR